MYTTISVDVTLDNNEEGEDREKIESPELRKVYWDLVQGPQEGYTLMDKWSNVGDAGKNAEEYQKRGSKKLSEKIWRVRVAGIRR